MVVTTPTASSNGGGSIMPEIEDHIVKAVNELIRRAYAGEDGELEILDRKEDAPLSGTVQDCEFGLMVLTVRGWLTERGSQLLGGLGDSERIKKLVVALAQRTIERITRTNVLDFGGGDLKGSPVFFSGDPYTLSKVRKVDVFSANLDSAMLIIAFLAAALEEFDDDLALVEFKGNESFDKRNIKTLKTAALFVCNEGLLYASKCRVYDQDRFVGYTCDPASNVANPSTGSIDEYDRLFFSWTACETIHELSNWTSYLDLVEKSGTAPSFLKDTRTLLEDLQQDLKRASSWCSESFLDRFRVVEGPPVGRIVSEVGKLGQNEAPGSDLDKELDRLAKYVTHVYHLSQYAAIRSIEPLGISIREVRDIVTLLDTIVGQHILSSGLDAATHPRLFQALSRYYSLGSSSREPYKDDAYFPLVVRSLSGLLTRTITTLGTVATRDEVSTLVLEFQRSLRARYDNLIERRPEPVEAGDEYLWSFAAGNPFVLYATQRTVFSLLEYAKFLQTMESRRDKVPREKIEVEMRDLLAKSFADVLVGPVIDKFIQSAPFLMETSSLLVSGDGQGVQLQLPLPEPKWAHSVILAILTEFKSEFEGQQQIYESLRQRANSLVEFRKKLHEARTKSSNAKVARVAKAMESSMANLLKTRGFRRLDEANEWDSDTLVPVLLDYLFRQFVSSSESLAAQLSGAPLWETIEIALRCIDSYEQALENSNTEKG